MSMIETLMGKTSTPASGLAALFAPRKKKRHALPTWAVQPKASKRPV